MTLPLNTPSTSKGAETARRVYPPSHGPGYRRYWASRAAYRAEAEEARLAAAKPVKRTPCAQKLVRAQQAELYVRALGLKGACAAMRLGPWQIHSLRRWLAGGPIPHNRGNHAKFKLSADDRAAILATRGEEKSLYVATLHGVHPSTVRRIWNGWEPKSCP